MEDYMKEERVRSLFTPGVTRVRFLQGTCLKFYQILSEHYQRVWRLKSQRDNKHNKLNLEVRV